MLGLPYLFYLNAAPGFGSPEPAQGPCEQHREQGDERRRRVDIYPI